jgi:molecular chaperone GrpE
VISGMSREEILQRFEEWLEGALAGEEPPRGIEAEILAAATGAGEGREPADAYSLRSAVTALTQEVKLQGRSFKELNETLGSQASRMAERERDLLVREAERRCRKEVLGVLIDLRDRLGRGLDSVRAGEAGISKPIPKPVLVPVPAPVQRGWLARMFSRADQPRADQPLVDQPRADQPRPEDDTAGATLAALKKGYELGLDRVDQTLEEFNAREIPCEGQAFDPRRMNAIDRQESSTVPEGTVIEVYRSGYEWNGELFRPAQVKVACAPAGKEHE